VLIRNFRSLIDLPLPEADQMKVLQALAAHFEAYEDIGNVYTQMSGSTRLVQIELYVKPDTTAAEIQALSADMENRLKQHFGKLLFHLIPLVKERAA
jgi:divalent metal cation (Fe/Co/Zn/Cd) transporter